MFTQTIGALAEAVDKRDPYTAQHSHRVKEIAVDIGRVMRLNEADLEALEWGGLLHDVGKIGVPDDVLLKQERLTKEERMIMNAHPVLGAQIIAPVTKLAPRAADHPPPPRVVQRLGLPGPADRRRDPAAGPHPPRRRRVRGDDRRPPVPDDAADRPSRRSPSSASSPAIQFDPKVVDAFVQTHWASTACPTRAARSEPRPIPLIAQAADRTANARGDEPRTAGASRRPSASEPRTSNPADASAAARATPGRLIRDAPPTRPDADRRRRHSGSSSACSRAAASTNLAIVRLRWSRCCCSARHRPVRDGSAPRSPASPIVEHAAGPAAGASRTGSCCSRSGTTARTRA